MMYRLYPLMYIFPRKKYYGERVSGTVVLEKPHFRPPTFAVTCNVTAQLTDVFININGQVAAFMLDFTAQQAYNG